MDDTGLQESGVSTPAQYLRSPDGLFYCQVPGCQHEGYPTRSRLTKHMYTHDRPYSCTQCHVTMATLRDIDKHLEVHKTADTRDTFSCPKCEPEKTFTRKDSRLKHMRLFHPELFDVEGRLLEPWGLDL
ncbi:hypothetical protein CC79DRAFT_1399742 [Sarocladium strictum]